MKVKGSTRFNTALSLGLLVLGVIGVGLYTLSNNGRENSIVSFSTYLCDAEVTDGSNFISGEKEFSNSNCQSSEESYSGKYSCKCTVGSIYSMSAAIDSLKGMDTLHISAYIKNKNAVSRLVFSSEKNTIFDFKENRITNSEWTLIEKEIIIPFGFKPDIAKVYVYLAEGSGNVFVDNLKVQIYPAKEDVLSTRYSGHLLEMKIKDENFKKIVAKRNEALQQGLLFSSKDDLVDADLKLDSKNYRAEVRLKGDLLDHLDGDRWSYRIQLKGGDEWNGMKNFSIHNSQARAHVAEWVMHQLFLREGIITPAYDFTSIEINEKSKGIYAYEQHFDNTLLDYNKRQRGPILKHNDDAYWENVQAKPNPFLWTEASYIELFNKENRKDENFAAQYERGKSMLQQFLDDELPAASIFNIDKLASYFALLDLSHALHAQAFTNIRFYLDPQSGLLEPIGYDCFGTHIPAVTPGWTSVGEGANYRESSKQKHRIENVYQFKLLQDTSFFRTYMQKVYHYTSSEFLKEIQKEMENDIKGRELYIKSDTLYKDYAFSWDAVFVKAKYTRDKLSPKPHLSLSAYKTDLAKNVVDVISHHGFPLEVVGFGVDTIMTEKMTLPQYVESYNASIPARKYRLKSSISIKYVFFKMLGNSKMYFTEVLNNLLPNNAFQPVSADLTLLDKYKFIEVDDGEVYISRGEHIIKDDIVIPSTHALTIEPGTSIRLQGGSILSYGAVKAIGSKNNPIQIMGDGAIGSAFMISGPDQPSVFTNCHFSNLNNYRNKNISTRGGVNVYSSEVYFEKCSFNNFKSREAISFNYASGSFKDSKVMRCKGDAFVSQYSVSTLKGVKFNDVGDTAIEVTAGSCTGGKISIDKVMNKGIKVSGSAKVQLSEVSIMNSEIGLVAEQNANVILYNPKFDNIDKGIILKNKQNQFTCITMSNYLSSNINTAYQVQSGGVLKINGSIKK